MVFELNENQVEVLVKFLDGGSFVGNEVLEVASLIAELKKSVIVEADNLPNEEPSETVVQEAVESEEAPAAY